MDYSGLTFKYKIDRPLTNEERRHQLRQDKKLDVEPIYQLSVIQMNSTYLELVDKYYPWKGLLSAFSIAVSLILIWFAISDIASFSNLLNTVYVGRKFELYVFEVFSLGFILIFLLASFWLLRKESFRHTHYPIRLNRKTRMVHVFRLDGSVLSAPWDDIFFTIGQAQIQGTYNVRGHILDQDGATVKETFSLSLTESMPPLDMDNPNSREGNYLRRHWEFIRRYMEEGPAQLIELVDFVMPVAEKRESLGHGFSRLNANWRMLWPLFLPVTILAWLGRIFAMRTSKIPRWPQDIEATSAIDLHDPYRMDAHHSHRGTDKTVKDGPAATHANNS